MIIVDKNREADSEDFGVNFIREEFKRRFQVTEAFLEDSPIDFTPLITNPDAVRREQPQRGSMKNYTGGTFVGVCDRRIDLGEWVTHNESGRQGLVKDREEGAYVFLYFIAWGDATMTAEKPDAITPLLNP